MDIRTSNRRGFPKLRFLTYIPTRPSLLYSTPHRLYNHQHTHRRHAHPHDHPRPPRSCALGLRRREAHQGLQGRRPRPRVPRRQGLRSGTRLQHAPDPGSNMPGTGEVGVIQRLSLRIVGLCYALMDFNLRHCGSLNLNEVHW